MTAAAPHSPDVLRTTAEDFGTLPDGRTVHRYRLGRAPGLELDVLDLGATVQRLAVTGGDQKRRNVALAHPDVADRLALRDYLGATVGRYANRIASGRFPLDGAEVVVSTHDRGHSLHGGPDGFDLRLWQVEHADEDTLTLSLTSPDGDMGFPGTVHARTTYQVGADTVTITMTASTDRPTVVNMTNHTYFNLDGESQGSTDDHTLTVRAQRYTPIDDTGIPLGDHADVAGTPLDLRQPTRLGGVVRTTDRQIRAGNGIDHNFVIDGTGLRVAAVLESAASRTRLELSTDQPGLQIYTGNHFNGIGPASDGGWHRQGDGIALEPQLFPDSPNHPQWPSARLDPGQTYRATIRWVFSPLTGH